MNTIRQPEKLSKTLSSFKHPSVITLFFLGISAGTPLLLIFSSLSLWLREAGIQRETVTYFSWAALGYSFKFVWAPLVDKLSLPILTKYLGRRRAWLLLSQLMIVASIIAMANIDPATQTLTLMAWAAVMLGFSSATQDIVIDAYRIESANSDLQAIMSSSYIAGYRVGMLLAGAGALFLASYFGSTIETYNYQAWQKTYLIIASTLLIGISTTLLISEPCNKNTEKNLAPQKEHFGFLFLFITCVTGFIASFYYSANFAEQTKSALSTALYNKQLAGFIVELGRLALALTTACIIGKLVILSGIIQSQLVKQTYFAPIEDFFQRYGHSAAWLFLALIGLYRISDIVLGVISNVFYLDLGFTTLAISGLVKPRSR